MNKDFNQLARHDNLGTCCKIYINRKFVGFRNGSNSSQWHAFVDLENAFDK